MNWQKVYETDPKELCDALKENFTTKLPASIESADDMREAQKLLSRLASQYSFLMAVSVEIKGMKRRLKREKAGKELIDAMMEREELLSAFCDSVKMSYNAVSRMITIRQQIYEEAKLLKYVP